MFNKNTFGLKIRTISYKIDEYSGWIFLIVCILALVTVFLLAIDLSQITPTKEERATEKRVEGLETRIEQLESSLTDTQNKLKETEIYKSELQKQLELAGRKIKTFEEHATLPVSPPIKTDETIKKLEKLADENERKLGIVEAAKVTLEKELELARKNVTETKKQTETLLSVKKEAEEKIKNLEIEIKRLEKVLTETEQRAKETETAKKKTEEDLSSMKKTIEEAKRQAEILSKEEKDELVKNLEKGIKELEGQLAEAIKKREEMGNLKLETEKALEATRKETQEISITSGNLEKKIKELENELTKTKNQAEKAETARITIEKELEKLKKKMEEPKEEVKKEVIIPGTTEEMIVEEKPKIRTYKVKEGETLSIIAEKVYGDATRWKEIYDANKEKIKAEGLKAEIILIIP